MHEILLASQAERDLRKLPAQTFRRLVGRIKELARDPRPPGCRKLHGAASDYRIRVGNYRINFEIDDAAQEVRIMRVRHRRDAYR